jgi:hypothetical protein
MDNSWDLFSGFGIAALIIGILILVVYIWSVVWAYKDAEQRGKPGWLVALLVALLSWPLGLIIWVIFRPDASRQY